MGQSFANMHVHLIFSTKNRTPWLIDSFREPLHAYMATVLQNLGCNVALMNSVEDHAHLLFDLSRSVSISQAVKDLKSATSKWIKEQPGAAPTFTWQAGYAAFAVSESNVPAVRKYIANQREHHRHKSFQEEFREFLKRHRIVFDERFVWD